MAASTAAPVTNSPSTAAPSPATAVTRWRRRCWRTACTRSRRASNSVVRAAFRRHGRRTPAAWCRSRRRSRSRCCWPRRSNCTTGSPPAAFPGRAGWPISPTPPATTPMHAHADVLVVGAGPAGLTAALTAARAGARVVLVDEQSEAGGSLLGGGDRTSAAPMPPNGSRDASPSWRPTPRCDTCSAPPRSVTTTTDSCWPSSGAPTTSATRAPAGCPVSGYGGSAPATCSSRPALTSGPSCSPTTTGPESCWRTAPGRSCTATAWWSDARRWCSPPTTAPTRRRSTCTDAGVRIEAIVDARDRGVRRACGDECDRRGIPLRAGAVVAGTRGDERIKHALVGDFDGVNVGPAEAVSCDMLLVSGGWNPAVHLFSQARGVLRYDAALGGFVPGEHLAGRERCGCGQRRHGPGRVACAKAATPRKRRCPNWVYRPVIPTPLPDVQSSRPRRVWCCGGCPAASRISSSTCSATPRSRTWRARSARACGRWNTSSATRPSGPRTIRARRQG